MNSTGKHNEIIRKLCRDFNVSELYAFVPEPNERIKAEDLIVFIVCFDEIQPEVYAENYYALKFALRDLLKSQVRLIEEQGLKNPFLKKYLNSNKKLIYGRQDKGLAV